MNYYEGKLYVFGGIHDVTWELDDLHIYDLKVSKELCRVLNGPHSNRNLHEKSKKSRITSFRTVKLTKIRALRRMEVKKKHFSKLSVSDSIKCKARLPVQQKISFPSLLMELKKPSIRVQKVLEKCWTNNEKKSFIKKRQKCLKTLR